MKIAGFFVRNYIIFNKQTQSLMARIYYLILFIMLIASCINHSATSNYPKLKTRQIDTSEYKTIKKLFGFKNDIDSATRYLGGLNPQYALADVMDECEKCQNSDWMNEGMLCGCKKLIVKQDDKYIVIKSIAELKKLYLPVSSEEEAISFAMLTHKLFPVLDESYFKNSYKYVGGKPQLTKVTKQNNAYIINMFRYKKFGCTHPYSTVTVAVSENGTVKIIKEAVAFSDPESNGLCID